MKFLKNKLTIFIFFFFTGCSSIHSNTSNSCSILEAIDFVSKKLKWKMKLNFVKTPRRGDHLWWITDNSKFKKDYPNWKIEVSLIKSLKQMVTFEKNRWYIMDKKIPNASKVVIIYPYLATSRAHIRKTCNVEITQPISQWMQINCQTSNEFCSQSFHNLSFIIIQQMVSSVIKRPM